MKQSGGDTVLAEHTNTGGFLKRLPPLNIPSTMFYVAVVALEYWFARSTLEPHLGIAGAHIVFVCLFIPLTIYYLWEAKIGAPFESWVRKIEAYVRHHPEIWFGIRATVEIVALVVLFFWIVPKIVRITPVALEALKPIFLLIFIIDTVVAFLAIYGNKQMREGIRDSVKSLEKEIDGIVRTDSIKEVFYLTTVVSIALKLIVGAVIVSGIAGAMGVVTGILVIIAPYFLFSVFFTAVYVTGSIQATARYWQWLLTEPPKIVVRFLFKINRDKVRCYDCGRIIPLVGKYTCSCGFTFKGYYFNWCPCCYLRATFVNCECGLSRKKPFIY